MIGAIFMKFGRAPTTATIFTRFSPIVPRISQFHSRSEAIGFCYRTIKLFFSQRSQLMYNRFLPAGSRRIRPTASSQAVYLVALGEHVAFSERFRNPRSRPVQESRAVANGSDTGCYCSSAATPQ